jgi:chemotaxis protein MotB
MARPPSDPSGFPVYPKMQVPPPAQRGSGDVTKPRGKFKLGPRQKLAAMIGGAALFGLLVGWLVTPTHSGELSKAKDDLEAAQKSASAASERAKGLDEQVDKLKKANEYSDTQLKEAQGKQKDAEQKVNDSEAVQKKLQQTIDKSQGSVTTEGEEIHLKLVDKVLFSTGEDQLTDRGKAVLAKVAVALKELPDKGVWVQGHTDDQPIYIPPPKKDAANTKAKPPAKGAKPKGAPTGPPPLSPHPITNWELSAARALSVVHYLQDVGKVDPSRLAALAFGQYRPISKSNKAQNRRIEIVLVPKKEVLTQK